VRGITFLPDGQQFITVGDDKTIKRWKTDLPDRGEVEEPTTTYISKVTRGIVI
jgi:WD40 repeat protein